MPHILHIIINTSQNNQFNTLLSSSPTVIQSQMTKVISAKVNKNANAASQLTDSFSGRIPYCVVCCIWCTFRRQMPLASVRNTYTTLRAECFANIDLCVHISLNFLEKYLSYCCTCTSFTRHPHCKVEWVVLYWMTLEVTVLNLVYVHVLFVPIISKRPIRGARLIFF